MMAPFVLVAGYVPSSVAGGALVVLLRVVFTLRGEARRQIVFIFPTFTLQPCGWMWYPIFTRFVVEPFFVEILYTLNDGFRVYFL